MGSVKKLNKEICKSIVEAAKRSIPRSRGNKKKKLVPWWTTECTEGVKARNKSFKVLKKILSYQNLINYKKQQATVRIVIRRTKREYWRKYCESLGRSTPLERVSGNRKEYGYPVMTNERNFVIEDKEKAELMAQMFAKVHCTGNLSSKEKEGREKTVLENTEVIQGEEEHQNAINMEFSMTELNNALKRAGKTTPGKDKINYYMLDNLSVQSKEVLLKLYNKVWKEGNLPNQWKEYCSHM